MSQYVCSECDTSVSKQSFRTHWRQDSLMQQVVSEQQLNRELSRRVPFAYCPYCENGLVEPRSELWHEKKERKEEIARKSWERVEQEKQERPELLGDFQ